jgi:hypothetical protein
MALILALVLGLYWVIRISCDKHETKKAREEFERVSNKEKLNRETWEAAVTNSELEAELEDRLYHNDEVLLQEIRDTWSHYYPGASVDVFYRAKKKPNSNIILIDTGNACSQFTALRILLANRGFLTYHDAILGISFYAYAETEYQMARSFHIQEQFILAVNEKLKQRGIDEAMYTDDDRGIWDFPRKERRVLDSGTVKWRPEISVFSMNVRYHNPSVK